MKKLFTILFVIFITTFVTAGNYKVLVFLPNNYGANFFLDISNFEKYGWEVTIAGNTLNVAPCPMYAQPLGCPYIEVDTLINDIQTVTSWDCVAVMSATLWLNYPNGNPCGDLIANTHALNLIQEAKNANMLVIGFCTGVRVLAAAQILNGAPVTGNPYYKNEYIAAGAIWQGEKRPPVIHNNIVTSTAGDFYNIHNCAAIFRAEALMAHSKNNRVGEESVKEKTQNQRGNSKLASEGAWAAVSDNAGGCVTAGFSYNNSNEADMFLAHYNSIAELLVSKQISIEGWQFATSIAALENSGYIISGFGEDSEGSFDGILVKVDNDLNVDWIKHLGGDEYDVITNIAVTNSGEIIFVGYTESDSFGEDDIWVGLTNNLGEIIWEQRIGTAHSEMAFGLATTADGNFVVAGNRGSFANGAGNRDATLIKMNFEGEILWQKYYKSLISDGQPEDDSEWAVEVTEAPDGSFYIVGHNDIVYNELKNGMLIKTNENGSETWRKSIGEGTFYDGLESVIATENDIFIGGFTTSTTTGEKGYFIRCNTAGEIVERKIITDDKTIAFHEIISSENSIIGLGTEILDDKSSCIAIHKLFETTSSNTTIHDIDFEVNIFPNPVINNFSIALNNVFETDIEINIYNTNGQLIFTKNILDSKTGQIELNRNELGIDNNNRGLYFMEIKSKDRKTVQKVVFL